MSIQYHPFGSKNKTALWTGTWETLPDLFQSNCRRRHKQPVTYTIHRIQYSTSNFKHCQHFLVFQTQTFKFKSPLLSLCKYQISKFEDLGIKEKWSGKTKEKGYSLIGWNGEQQLGGDSASWEALQKPQFSHCCSS